jgi:hypothetical protein
MELEVDKLLSKWTAEWRQCFMHWSTIALDLANHPPNRAVTHWYVQSPRCHYFVDSLSVFSLHIVVEPRHFQTKSYRNYIVSYRSQAFHLSVLRN